MPKKSELSIETRALIISHHKIGNSSREIAKELQLDRRTVDYNIKKYRLTGTLLNKKELEDPK